MAVPQQQIEQFQVVTNPGQPDETRDQTFEARLLAEIQKDYDLTRTSRARRYYLWLISSLFAKAIHYTWFDHRTGVIQEWSQEKISKCMYTPVPLLYYAVENLAAQYTNSNPKIEPMPANADDPKMKTVVRALYDYADYLDFEFYRANPFQRQTESKLIPLRGVYNFLEWDRTGGPKVQLPQYAPQQAMVCADCGAEVQGGDSLDGGLDSNAFPGGGTGGSGAGGVVGQLGSTQSPPLAEVGNGGPGAATACPQCGSPNVQPQVIGIANQGNVEGRQGCVRRRVIDPFQVEIYDRTKGVEESPYLIFDEVIFKSKALKEYPWLKAVKGSVSLGNSQEGFLGLHYLMQLETIMSNTGRLDQSQPDYMTGLGGAAFSAGYQGSFLHDKLCWRRQAWLDPDEYADSSWVTDQIKALQLPGSNKLIPPGSRVGDMFPKGCRAHIINGNQIVKLENQDKNKVWTYVAYRVPAEGQHGAGVNPLVSLNRGYDEANSFEMQALLMSALGIIVADERVQNVRNIPGSIATIPLAARLPGESIQSLVARLDMGGGQAISAAEPVKEGYRGHLGDLSMSANPQGYGNRPQGVGEGTATAVRYNAGATNTLVQPPMELYAAAKAQVIQQAIELERTYNQRPRLYGKFGQSAAKWLDPMQIPEDVRFGASEGSWKPRTVETEKEDVVNGIGLGVGTGAIQNKAVEDKAMKTFGFDSETDTYEDWAVKGEKRLDALKQALPAVLAEQAQLEQQISPEEMQAAQQAGMVPNPAQRLIELAGAAPRPLDMEGHVHLARFWVEIYNSDEFDSFDPVLQDAIEELYIASQDGIGQALAVQTDQMVTGQAPAMQAQAQQAAQQTQQEQAGQGAEHAQEMEGMAAEDEKSENEHRRAMEQKKHDSKEADKSRRHERFQSERDHRHTITETKEKTRGAIAVSKAKPKPKPATKR